MQVDPFGEREREEPRLPVKYRFGKNRAYQSRLVVRMTRRLCLALR
jgi:hypothetical protein